MKWAVSLLLFVIGFAISYTSAARTELPAGAREAIAWRSLAIGLVVSIAYYGVHSLLEKRRKKDNN